MCGIVAAISSSNIVPVLIEGLRKLEYRGYDSAGLAVLNPGLNRVRSLGRVAELATLTEGLSATRGIAHTRWATHGVPSERNAHPHVSNGLAVVHNGIIENFAEIRERMLARGHVYESETDTESIAHLIQDTLRTVPDLLEAVRVATGQLTGAYAIAVLKEGDEVTVMVVNVDRKNRTINLSIKAKDMADETEAIAKMQSDSAAASGSTNLGALLKARMYSGKNTPS